MGTTRLINDVAYPRRQALYPLRYFQRLGGARPPRTAQARLVYDFTTDYTFSNAMTSDGMGDLSIAAVTGSANRYVLKLNPRTLKIDPVINPTAPGLESAGGLAFLTAFST